jgi:alkylated DNA repair dioxygenase AlkB
LPGRGAADERGVRQKLQESLFDEWAHTYVSGFLTSEETAAVFDACSKLPFKPRYTWAGWVVKHTTLTYTDEIAKRYKGPRLPWRRLPGPLVQLAAKLTNYAGKVINYVSIVRYLNGDEFMQYHQHEEDEVPGRDMSVYIVSTGAERPLEIRNLKTNACTQVFARQGSLIVLPSEYNITHEHAVPKFKAANGVRYAMNCKAIAV